MNSCEHQAHSCSLAARTLAFVHCCTLAAPPSAHRRIRTCVHTQAAPGQLACPTRLGSGQCSHLCCLPRLAKRGLPATNLNGSQLRTACTNRRQNRTEASANRFPQPAIACHVDHSDVRTNPGLDTATTSGPGGNRTEISCWQNRHKLSESADCNNLKTIHTSNTTDPQGQLPRFTFTIILCPC